MAAELSAEAAAAKLQRWQRLTFAALFSGYFLYTAGRRGVTAAQDSLKSELGFTMSDIGTLNSAFTAGELLPNRLHGMTICQLSNVSPAQRRSSRLPTAFVLQLSLVALSCSLVKGAIGCERCLST